MESADDRASDRIPDSASDADSDLEELQGDIAKFDESVREFLASHRGTSAGGREAQSTIRGRGARGPRKAAKPRGDITARLSKVNQAFLSGDYDRALDIAFEVIRINAETYQAWTALSSIFRERGELDRSLSAMVYAAHLRPKDVSGWLRCASFALDSIIDGESTNLHTARLCFSAALRADRTNIEARVGKAGICHRQGHLSTAITEYKYVLKRHPYDLGIIRKLAEACLDGINAASAIPSAVSAYKQYFDRIVDHQDKQDDTLWHDIGVYIELIASLGRYQEAIFELKRLSRLLSGRLSESYWDDWRIDDREWDTFEERRSSVPGYNARGDSPSRLGLLLPLDLRIRLATYRLKLGDQQEALNHLDLFNSDEMTTEALAKDFPFLIFDLGVELSRGCLPELAIRYFELLRNLPGEPDAAVLLQIGRCHLASAEQAKAEELFLAALEVDEDNIDARIELANMYETAREDEEALILAAEALALREAQDQSAEDGFDKEPRHARTSIGLIPRTSRRDARVNTADRPAMVGSVTRRPMIPRRYRPKRLAGPDKRRQEEQTRAFKLSQQYSIVRDLKQQISAGHNELIPAWMASSKELIDDFRSLKRFYSWDKYLHFLGSKGLSQEGGSAVPGTELSQMYERLSRSIAPQTEQGHQLDTLDAATHQGITFDDWLDLFLEYAIGLAILHRRQEAYQVCAAAKDSTVFQSTKHDFTIYYVPSTPTMKKGVSQLPDT
ncbi:transcription factor TFIIIC subunit tfc4 [Conoideocrella luteorostrata]|uniref:Transcription factor TFIIIC subunit tfc4 n=1 Tax=Conoideocrella luteorostrata TaxID=1105319 RepID=A0AAJ0G3N7_9HYPO|nr:transcription factor TFIIIC subunit tfc4 [Conoideocrella luteorostrata]